MRIACRLLPLIAAALLAAAGCVPQTSAPTGEPGTGGATGKISLLVPCGQLGPFSEAVELFEAANPGVAVSFVPENMIPIVNKIINGKERPDLFLSMGDLEMDTVEQAGFLVEGTRTRYAENSLALMVPKDNPAGIKTIADLAKPEVRGISIADPKQNSVGKHAIEALERAGIYGQVADKIFIMSMAADSKDATAKQQVQASIGYYPCAVEVHSQGAAPVEQKNLTLLGHISPDLYEPFWCEGAVIEGSENPEGGKQLLAFLTTPEVQEIFQKWSFVSEVPASTGD